MKMRAMAVDANGRSYWSTIDIPMVQAGPTSMITARQDAQYWGLAVNEPGHGNENGPNEMHLTHVPRIVWAMAGHSELTMQDGQIYRTSPGDGVFVHGSALHHSAFVADIPSVTLNVTFRGTEGYTFK